MKIARMHGNRYVVASMYVLADLGQVYNLVFFFCAIKRFNLAFKELPIVKKSESFFKVAIAFIII